MTLPIPYQLNGDVQHDLLTIQRYLQEIQSALAVQAISSEQISADAITTVQLQNAVVTNEKIADGAVSLAKLTPISASNLLGRTDSSDGAVQQLQLAIGLQIVGTVLGFASDGTWTVSGTSVDKSLVSGDTLTATQDVLGTLIQVLIAKGILAA